MSADIKELLQDFLKQSPKAIHQYAFVNPKEVSFTQAVRDACEVNYCGRYGKSWACPPGVGEWQTLRDRYQTYQNGFVFTTLHSLEDSFDIEGMDEARQKHREAEKYLLELLTQWNEPTELLGAGGCAICKTCTYPDSPCRYPEKMRRSMEACGMDVVNLSKTVGINYFNGPDTVTYFSMLFY